MGAATRDETDAPVNPHPGELSQHRFRPFQPPGLYSGPGAGEPPSLEQGEVVRKRHIFAFPGRTIYTL